MINKCTKCGKEFKIIKSSKLDGLCGKCRSKQNYLNNTGKYRKTKTCICGKKILKNSNFCSSCSQLGSLNHSFTDGKTVRDRTCSCGNKISTGSKKGRCMNCYNKYRKENSSRVYNTKEYRDWRTSIYKRDSYKCVICGNNKELNAHHIYPKRDFPDLVYDIDNGITLCKTCHAKIYGKEYEYISFFEKIIAESKFRELGESCKMEIPNQAREEIFLKV